MEEEAEEEDPAAGAGLVSFRRLVRKVDEDAGEVCVR